MRVALSYQGVSYPADISETSTVADAKVHAQRHTGLHPDFTQLFFGGRERGDGAMPAKFRARFLFRSEELLQPEFLACTVSNRSVF